MLMYYSNELYAFFGD